MAQAIVNDKIVNVGDLVGFKSDVEQYGRIKSIFGDGEDAILVLTSRNGFIGDYIGGQFETTVEASRCWFEG